jgi:GNAT superfamily N-acetyltransferase
MTAADGAPQVTVRRATAVDGAALAQLRWAFRGEEDGLTPTDRDDFVESFAAWLVDHQSTHVPFLAHVGGDAVGMAWLMIADRVPSPSRRHRRCGDVQSVFVVPELRNGGVGALLLNHVLAEARALGLEHVTVHSSDRAVRFYEHVGFDHHRSWLRWAPA